MPVYHRHFEPGPLQVITTSTYRRLPFQQLLLPLRHLVRMDLVMRGNRLHRTLAPHRLQRNLRLPLRTAFALASSAASWRQRFYTLTPCPNFGEHFRLRVDVRDDEFYRLTEGQHPITDEQMVRHRIAAEYKNQEGQTVSSVEHDSARPVKGCYASRSFL